MNHLSRIAETASHLQGEWLERHKTAIRRPKLGCETGIVLMLQGWLEYADNYNYMDSGYTIGEDSVLGRYWEDIGFSIIQLLDGETGRLDCGSIDRLIREIMKSEGLTGQQ